MCAVSTLPDTAKQTRGLTEALLALAPAHQKFLDRRFNALEPTEVVHLERISDLILRIVGDDLDRFVADYVWYCEEQIKEEIHFRRHGAYRLTTFAEAEAQVYANADYMAAYMNALLMTQIWWSNHSELLRFYCEKFLPLCAKEDRFLEIGPGHGFLMYLALSAVQPALIEGWDISPASIAATERCLEKMGVREMPVLRQMDMLNHSAGSFDRIVFSEVLEHMEDPGAALATLRNLLSEHGRLFLHVPINSPAPDHLFNLSTPDEMRSFIEAQGFRVLDHHYAPATNYSLEQAVKNQLTVSCGFILCRSQG